VGPRHRYGLRPAHNLAQRLGLTQLAKQHGYHLSPTAESPRMPFRLVFLHRRLKPILWNHLQYLAKDATYSFHGEVS
jgi:hypothetical protein